jgi:hypothetical protein
MAGVKLTRGSVQRIANGLQTIEGMQKTSPAGPGGYGGQSPWDTLLVGKTDAAHNKSASGTISVWSGTTSAGLSDTGDNITAWNRMGNIQTGKWVYIWTFPWGYEITAAEC